MDHPAKLDTRITVLENELRGNGRKGICEIVEDMSEVIDDVKSDLAEIKNRKMFLQDARTRVIFWITVIGFVLIDLTTFIYLVSKS